MNHHDPVDNTQNRQWLVSTARLLSGPRAKQVLHHLPKLSILFFIFIFIFCFLLFYFLLFYFALLLYLALPSPALFFSALLCSDLFYVGSERPSGAIHSDQAVIGR